MTFLKDSQIKLNDLIFFIKNLNPLQFWALFLLVFIFLYLSISKIILTDLEGKLRSIKSKEKSWPLLEDLMKRESLKPNFLIECVRFLRDLEKTQKEYPTIWSI